MIMYYRMPDSNHWNALNEARRREHLKNHPNPPRRGQAQSSNVGHQTSDALRQRGRSQTHKLTHVSCGNLPDLYTCLMPYMVLISSGPTTLDQLFASMTGYGLNGFKRVRLFAAEDWSVNWPGLSQCTLMPSISIYEALPYAIYD